MSALTRTLLKIRLCFFFFLLCFSVRPWGKSNIVWLEKNIDLGIIREEEGQKNGEFKFVVAGKTGIVINDVRVTCGCTNVVYPQDYLEKGDTVSIQFSFDPSNRPGKFEKTIKVYFNGIEGPERLTFTGTVIGSKKTLQLRYPIENGTLRFETSNIRVGELSKGMRRHSFVGLYNQCQDTLAPQIGFVPEGIEVNLTPKKIAPGETATLSIYTNTTHLNHYGKIHIPIEINWGNSEKESSVLIYNAVVLPARVEKIDANKIPVIKIEPEIVEIDLADENRRQIEIQIFNEGNSELEIFGILNESNHIKIESHPEKLAPQKSGSIILEIAPTKIADNVIREELRVMSNDPVFPVIPIRVVGANFSASDSK